MLCGKIKNRWILKMVGGSRLGSDITMYYKKYQPSHVKGWHVMNVCDVDGEDTATVVSWGRKYTLKLAELKKDCKFVWVRYGV